MSPARTLLAEEMTAIEWNAEFFGVSRLILMENAGRAVAREILRRTKRLPHVAIFAGLGGNGGDGFVTARHLAPRCRIVHLIVLGDPNNIQNEAAASSRLNHPNTITVFDFGKTDSNSLYIAMEYIEGLSLDDEIKNGGAMNVQRACQIAIQICGSLQDAHDNNIVHRDLKPENVMLCERGGDKDVVKVLDFGIAKILADEDNNVIASALIKVRVHAEQTHRPQRRADFFRSLTPDGLLQRFALLDLTTRNIPSRLIRVLNEQHLLPAHQQRAHPNRERARDEVTQTIKLVEQP